MRPYRKKKRSEWATKAILFLASLAATIGFGLITPSENTPWVIIVAFCASLQLTMIVAAISIPSPPDPREFGYKGIFRGWLLPEEEDEEREKQRQNDQLGFDSPDKIYPSGRR